MVDVAGRADRMERRSRRRGLQPEGHGQGPDALQPRHHGRRRTAHPVHPLLRGDADADPHRRARAVRRLQRQPRRPDAVPRGHPGRGGQVLGRPEVVRMTVVQTPAGRAAGGLAETSRRPARRSRKTPYQGSARGFIAPGVFLVAVLLYLPLLWTTFLSFTEYNGLGDPAWVGFDNYVEMFQDPAFVGSLMNTLLWVAGTLLIPVGVGLILALLTWNLPGGIWLRLPFLIPYAISGIGVGVIWSFILSANGALDQALAVFGVTDPPRWLVDAPLNTVVMILAASWQG